MEVEDNREILSLATDLLLTRHIPNWLYSFDSFQTSASRGLLIEV